MDASFIEKLLEFGSLGLFAGFLIWQHGNLQKRLDKLTDSFKEEVRELEDRHEKAEAAVGDRFDAMLGRYEDQRGKVFSDIVTTLTSNSSRLDEAVTLIETGLAEMRQHYAEARLREISRKSTDN